MNGAIVAVGSELLLGDVVNSNAAWLGKQLAAAGIDVVASTMVADDIDRLTGVIHAHLAEADVLILCGGLGPTVDDLTRDAVAQACQAPLQRHTALEDVLRAKFAAYQVEMPENVLQQADVPTGAEALDNPAGTAPGLWLEYAGKVVVALPGPPHELHATSAPVWPRLAERSGTRVTTRQVLVAGLGESAVAERVESVVDLPDGVALSYLAGGAVVRVRFTTTGDPAPLAAIIAAVDQELGPLVWGHDDDTLDGVVHRLLANRGQTVGVAESLTGGLLAARLTERPGSSATFRGGLVVYATELKHALAGVPEAVLDQHGAVSEQTALVLAEGARTRLGADWGIGVTGVAGPDEQEGHPVGTVFMAVAGPAGHQVLARRLPGDRERIRLWTVTSALDLLRRTLQGQEV
jgi:nicotinamide-nucleotide amidase